MPYSIHFFALDGIPIPFLYVIFAAELQRVYVQTSRDFIYMRLQCEKALWRSVAAHRSSNWQICINSIRLEEPGLCAVKTQCFMSRTPCHCKAMGSICASIAN